jgi:wyosine [tRNA(Phe)-imidazoG37] synthetase (radical SAM superfamily)
MSTHTLPRATPPRPARNFLHHRLVYCVISQRARGLSVGVNMNPDKRCNFDCVYCEVDRREHSGSARVNITRMTRELEEMLTLARDGRMNEIPEYARTPPELLRLKEVALSGDGEPTLCPNFSEVVKAVTHLRARERFPFFKIVLITNCTALQAPDVREGIEMLTSRDAIWAKLDGGTQACVDRVNRGEVPLATILENIVALGKKRPIVIQSLFPLLDEMEPDEVEIDAYIERLRELRDRGTAIQSVQVYSAHRAAFHPGCGHLPLRALSGIARRVRVETGLEAEVF